MRNRKGRCIKREGAAGFWQVGPLNSSAPMVLPDWSAYPAGTPGQVAVSPQKWPRSNTRRSGTGTGPPVRGCSGPAGRASRASRASGAGRTRAALGWQVPSQLSIRFHTLLEECAPKKPAGSRRYCFLFHPRGLVHVLRARRALRGDRPCGSDSPPTPAPAPPWHATPQQIYDRLLSTQL